MADPEKSAPEALREEVERMLTTLLGCPFLYAVPRERLRAAHERPGAYGPDPDSLPNTARELLQWVSDTIGLSAENEAAFATKLGNLLASECVSASREAETAHEAAREALAEAGVECGTVAEGIRILEHNRKCSQQAAALAHESTNDWMQRARKAEAAGGVGLLRRACKAARKLPGHEGPYGLAVHQADVVVMFDRLIAEAEARPAEETCSHCDTTEVRGGCGVCGNALPCKKHSRPAEEPECRVPKGWAPPGTVPKREPREGDDSASVIQCEYDDPEIIPKIVDALDDLDARVRELAASPQDGDDVLRAFLAAYDTPYSVRSPFDGALAVLVRRALR